MPGLCSSICRIEDEDNEQLMVTTLQANMYHDSLDQHPSQILKYDIISAILRSHFALVKGSDQQIQFKTKKI